MGKARKYNRYRPSLLDERRDAYHFEMQLMALEYAGVIERKGDMVRAVQFEGGVEEGERRIAAMLDSFAAESESKKKKTRKGQDQVNTMQKNG